jgi:hypothetical protein
MTTPSRSIVAAARFGLTAIVVTAGRTSSGYQSPNAIDYQPDSRLERHFTLEGRLSWNLETQSR